MIVLKILKVVQLYLIMTFFFCQFVSQRPQLKAVERPTCNREIVGSIPTGR